MKTMNEQTIWTRLINEGFTREGAAGLMGNLYAESMLNPQNLQNTFEKKLGYSDATYTKAVDSTAYKNFVNDKAGYGLAQWTYYTRKQALLNFARSQNKSIGDLDMQLDFLIKELKESFSKVYNSLKTITSVREASNIVLLQFEKPADQSNTVKNLRSSYAQKYYEQFANLVIKEEEPKQPEVKPVVEQTTSTLETTATFAEATPKNNSSFLQPDSQVIMNGVIVNEYSLYKHNTKGISMPPLFKKKVIGVTIHNTEWINAATGTTPAEQYTRATRNGNMKDVRVHFYVDNVCAWQNLPYEYQGWHAADGSGNGNTATIAIECIMSSKYNDKDKRSEDNCARLAAALLKKYGLGINDLYTHTHWLNVRDGIKGTTDYLNTKKRTNVKYCLPIDSTELLTPYGWKSLADITTDDVVMQYDPDLDSMEFVNVENVVEPYMATTLQCRDIEATGDHRMLVKSSSSKSNPVVKSWDEVLQSPTSLGIKNGGHLKYDEGLPLTDDEIRLLVWVQGDGNYMRRYNSDGGIVGVEFHLKKQRKIDRVCEVLDNIGIEYSTSHCRNGSVHIRSYGINVYAFCESWLDDKVFSYKLLNMNQHQFKVFIDELVQVDGGVYGKQRLYFSSISQNIDFVQALSAIHDVRTRSMTLGTSKKFYGLRPVAVSFTESGMYYINGKLMDSMSRETMVSCVTVPSGFILIRQNNMTFIVGNCPLYILPHWNDFKNKVLMYMGQTVEPQKPVNESTTETSKPTTTNTGTSFRITVQSNELNVRKDAGVEYPITTKIHKGEVYTIVDTKKSKDGGIWGKLKSGAGWINIGSAYVKK